MDEAAIALASRLRPELPSLLEPDEVAAVDAELADLIDRGRLGEPVAEPILRLLRTHPTVRQRAAQLANPGTTRGIQPSPGRARPPMPPRYVCPNDGYEWFQLDVATPIPGCPHDGAALILQDTA